MLYFYYILYKNYIDKLLQAVVFLKFTVFVNLNRCHRYCFLIVEFLNFFL